MATIWWLAWVRANQFVPVWQIIRLDPSIDPSESHCPVRLLSVVHPAFLSRERIRGKMSA